MVAIVFNDVSWQYGRAFGSKTFRAAFSQVAVVEEALHEPNGVFLGASAFFD
jgi:hypothetical protein